jgi:hypothetical protein
MISPALLDELRARIPVSTVVGRRVRLKRAGREWRGLSPFNKERTPSFFVNDAKRFWHDFSSGKHGDVFAFVKETEGVGFREAVERVAAMGGLATELKCAPPPRPAVPPVREPDADELQEKADRLLLAQQLWRRSLPAEGTIAETYLRARGYKGIIPATVRFLPRNGVHAPAVICAFGLAVEGPLPEPSPDDPKAVPWAGGPWIPDSALHIADSGVVGVHLIKLRPDGSYRLRDDGAKITIGKGFVVPIVLAPVGDRLALTIAEGIEDALTDHDLTGRGAWAAASAGRMPGLADLVPSYVESVTVLVDDNEAGRVGSAGLADALDRRGIGVLMAGG